jgi:hypothetical protein
MTGIDRLEFRVEVWDDYDDLVLELVAVANHVLVARAAYDAAAKMRPDANLVLRQGTRVITRTRE